MQGTCDAERAVKVARMVYVSVTQIDNCTIVQCDFTVSCLNLRV